MDFHLRGNDRKVSLLTGMGIIRNTRHHILMQNTETMKFLFV